VSAFEFMLSPRNPKQPAYRWLCDSVRSQILAGRLRPGARLPATRDLAKQYRLARGTIVSAFEQLKGEGYVEGNVGSGTYVRRILPEELLQLDLGAGAPKLVPTAPPRAYSAFAKRVEAFSALQPRPTRAFRPNMPALDLFPATLWAQITARRLRRASTNLLLGCDHLGYEPLRAVLADYLATSRGVNCDPEQVVVVAGAQEALDLAARLFLDPGDRVCLENPAYPGAARVFAAAGAKVATISMDGPRLRFNQPAFQRLRLLYLTPGHQYPLGTTMTVARRLELLEWARQSGALIFEDDYDSEYRYSGRPVPAMQGLDRSGLVLFAGSFSKVLFPSLRLGYLVVPPDMIPAFAAAKSITTRHAPLLDQAVLCDFISEGHFARHLRRMREIYAERLSVLLESARDHLAGLLEISGVEAGLQTVGWLREGLSEQSAAQAAAERSVEVTPLRACSFGRAPRAGLQLGFAAVDPREIRRGVRELALALSELSKRPR